MKQELNSVIGAIKKGATARCLLVFGDDLPVQEAARKIINSLVSEEKRTFNLERFDGRTAVWDQIQAALMTPPFLAGTKIIWIENAPYFISREQKRELGSRVMQHWSEGKEQEASRLLIDLLVVEGWTLERWQSLTGGARREIAELLGADATEEIDKLIAFCKAQDIDLHRRRAAQAQGLEELLAQGLPPWGFLLMTAAQVDRRMRLYKHLEELSAILYLGVERERSGKLSREKLLEFVNQRLRDAGKTADAQARELIIQRSASNLRSLSQELEKLALYAGPQAVLRTHDAEAILTDYGEGWVFDLTRAIGERNASAALSHLNRLVAAGEPPLKLLGALASEARRLLGARQLLDGELRGRWKRGMSYQQFQQQVLSHGTAPPMTRNPYADYMCLLRAERLSMTELRDYMSGIHDADLRLKSSGSNPKLIMERLILGACLGASKKTSLGASK